MQNFDAVNLAFSKQSEVFDEYEKGNEILKWMRSQTRNHLIRNIKKDDKILEINAGTGLDAVFLAENGYRVHCIDIADGMLKKLNEKINSRSLSGKISSQKLSFTELDKLSGNNFDYIFSNFGGLNCSNSPGEIFNKFTKILKPGGKVTLVMISPICPWELALVLKGNFKTAFRRLHAKGINAEVEGISFPTYYYSVKDVLSALGPEFNLVELQGLASLSPPPYMENFPKKFPGIYKALIKIDEKISHLFPFNRWADHFILTVQYNSG